jgi:hypothetical protein
MSIARVELRGVSKSYGNGGQPVEGLHDISRSAEPGAANSLLALVLDRLRSLGLLR